MDFFAKGRNPLDVIGFLNITVSLLSPKRKGRRGHHEINAIVRNLA